MLRLLLIVIPLAVTIYAFIEAITAKRDQVRNLPKWLWILLIVVLWIGGAVLWLILGRPRNNTAGPGVGQAGGYQSGPVGPDDDPDFIADLNRKRKKPTKES